MHEGTLLKEHIEKKMIIKRQLAFRMGITAQGLTKMFKVQTFGNDKKKNIEKALDFPLFSKPNREIEEIKKRLSKLEAQIEILIKLNK